MPKSPCGFLAAAFGACLGVCFVVALLRQGFVAMKGRPERLMTREDQPITYWFYVVMGVVATAAFFAAAVMQWICGSPPSTRH